MAKKLNIHCLQHVHFEGLGSMEEWISKNSHNLTYTRFYNNEILPDINETDVLIIMGGPMSVHDEANFHWLKKEKEFIKKAIDSQKIVIGICLGAQLISHVLGGTVSNNREKEIGWFPIQVTDVKLPVLQNVPKVLNVFHWHGETFTIPENAVRLFQSEGCENQGFLLNNQVLGFQFHFEVTDKTMRNMVLEGKDELIENKYIQSSQTILSQTQFIEQNNKIMAHFLDFLIKD
ncbi:type 1 glutamine amidotransferase [Flavobacterium notoginsengisoli]|uniref:type 1 glutamine amidotransferase n=1 Tax=Flavobacterium notoginsengisoli TaxID=1478199 RepID=UPI0036409FC9